MPLFKHGLIALTVSVLLILIIGQFTDIDLMIEDYYYDEALRVFPWNKTWFAKDFMHGWVKFVIIKSGYLLILLVLVDAVFRFRRISPFMRVRLRFVALTAVMVPFVIRSIKEYTVLHCPYGIDRYGGDAPFVRLLDSVPTGFDIGHCFPAGHATVGLWLAALCVFWLPHKPRAALAAFCAGLGVGLLLGWVQQMRGAHFLFHTLWSAWLTCLIIWSMLMIFANKYFDLQDTNKPRSITQ